MSSLLARSAVLRLLRQGVAAACVGLVLALSWLAVDDGAHAALHAAADSTAAAACSHPEHAHGHDHAPESGAPCDEPACVITQFFAGATDVVALVALLLLGALAVVAARWQVVESLQARVVFAWVAPSCGPPAAA